MARFTYNENAINLLEKNIDKIDGEIYLILPIHLLKKY